MLLFLCEKPSQGKDIAKVLGATQRGDGCLNGEGVTVTWCIGHLLETAPPETYNPDYKKWSLSHLPIVPSQWRMEVKKSVDKQFKVVKKLLSQASELVIATDADREGEMIARELIDYCGYRGPIRRLWLSALNDTSIRQALNHLKAADETLPLYYSALTRSRADWLIGMNLSRLFTLLGQQSGYDGVLSVGRVQTPTLGLVVQRDKDIADFQPKPFWVIDVQLTYHNQPFNAVWQAPINAVDESDRCIIQSVAQVSLNLMLNHRQAQVLSIETERVKESPPLAFDLGTLQEVCSRKFGLGAQETLDVAQSLYEKHKATTYPRTDCGYLPESMLAEVPTVLNALIKTDPTIQPTVAQLDTALRSRLWNDKKITAHHGIIPTLEPVNLSAMSETEQAVYQLIRLHYLAQFLPVHEYDKTVALFDCAAERLRADGKQITVQGWRKLFNDHDNETSSRSQILPSLTKGTECQVHDAQLRELTTQPPKPYTEGELIKSMKNVARLVTDPRLKQILRDTTGIGTEATRAGIIKGLFQRGYLVNKGKAVQATPAAFALINAIPSAIADPGMTAIWEQALDSIEQGQMSIDDFINKQATWLAQLVQQYAGQSLEIASNAPKCSLCGAVMKKRNGKNGEFWGCSKYPECTGIENVTTKPKRRRKAVAK